MSKLLNYITRDESLISRKKNLEHLHTFLDFPIFMGCTSENIDKDIFADMTWEIDPETGLIQLSKLIPMDLLYMDQHMDATGLTWEKYNFELAKFIIKNKLGNILEIGGGSGKLANLILASDHEIKYVVVEPNPTFNESERLKIIKDFFSKDLNKFPIQFSTIILSQVLEHVYDPEIFLNEVYEKLPVGGYFIFGYPNLEFLFSNKHTNAINFEHTMLLTEYFLDYFLKKTGFKIIEKINHHNHSHFYSVEKVEKKDVLPNILNRYQHYKKMFEDYINFHKELVIELNSKIESIESPIFIFGAHIFSQYLFAFGLKTNKIICILDNSPLKHEKRLYGTELIVRKPSILTEYKNPTVILKAGLYNKEIMDDILTNINSTTVFI